MNRKNLIPGLIETPPRSSRTDAILVLSALAILSLVMIFAGAGAKLALVVLTGLIMLAIARRAVYAVHAALLALIWLLLAAFVPLFHAWPLNIFAPLVIYGASAGIVPQLRRSVGWIHGGRLNPEVIKLIIGTIFISSLALVAWVILARQDLSRHLALIPELPLWAYPFAGLGFAVFNAAMEEAIFRGILMEALDSALGGGYWSAGIQAIPFAALHYVSGFPNGASGFIMVLVYGAMLGAIRRLSKGIIAPFIAHVAADATIFSILVFILFR